jgi:uncharacterized protein (DUF362 family)
MTHGMRRRDFLVAAAVPLIAGACRAAPYNRDAFVLPDRSSVALLPASDYSADLSDLIFRGLRTLNLDLSGRRVLLKPNMVEYEIDTAINTHPHVIVGAAIACRRAGAANVVVAEGPGHRRDIEYLLASTGLDDYLREERIEFVDLNHDDVALTPLRSSFTGVSELALPVSLLEADLVVTLPKLKTHHWAGMTCSMKNLFGTVPGAVYGWPKNVLHQYGIQQSILDLTATIKPGLAIVDAVVAMEGDGPIMGKPRRVGFIAMGTDPVAVDATCARIIGLDPDKMPYLKEASAFLGVSDEAQIVHRGELPRRYATRFDVVHTLEHLRGS